MTLGSYATVTAPASATFEIDSAGSIPSRHIGMVENVDIEGCPIAITSIDFFEADKSTPITSHTYSLDSTLTPPQYKVSIPADDKNLIAQKSFTARATFAND